MTKTDPQHASPGTRADGAAPAPGGPGGPGCPGASAAPAAVPPEPPPRRRSWRSLHFPAWARAALLTLGVACCTGITVLTGQALGYETRASVILSVPVGVVVGFLLALILVLLPAWRSEEDRRWLVRCLDDVSRIDREQRFTALLAQGEHHELNELARAIHRALLSAHRDRLEAAQLRRELESRVQRQTRAVVAELSKLSATDELTGMLNRRGFDAAFARLFEACAASGEELALLAIDLDHFKTLNDTHGHDAGDRALRAAGEVLRAQLRHGDAAGRIGGDEFFIALRGSGSEQALAVARRLIELFARTPHAIGYTGAWPSFSIGIACAGEHRAAGPAELRRMADEALYAAKRAGRRDVALFRITGGTPGGPGAGGSAPAPREDRGRARAA